MSQNKSYLLWSAYSKTLATAAVRRGYMRHSGLAAVEVGTELLVTGPFGEWTAKSSKCYPLTLTW